MKGSARDKIARETGEALSKLHREVCGDNRSSSVGFDARTIIDLVISRTNARALHDDVFVDRWIQVRLKTVRLHTVLTPVRRIDKWLTDKETGDISHESGRFFTITGVRVRHRTDTNEIEWDQPIIEQPETGILGILATRIRGVLHFCLQAKEEPGNINSVQLAPTVQATYSNYSGAHGGRLPQFIELFLDPPEKKIMFSRLQTEDGGRFLYKSNRNMIVYTDHDELRDLPDGFIWLTLRQIGVLLKRDNLINSCARSVLACLV